MICQSAISENEVGSSAKCFGEIVYDVVNSAIKIYTKSNITIVIVYGVFLLCLVLLLVIYGTHNLISFPLSYQRYPGMHTVT